MNYAVNRNEIVIEYQRLFKTKPRVKKFKSISGNWLWHCVDGPREAYGHTMSMAVELFYTISIYYVVELGTGRQYNKAMYAKRESDHIARFW